MLLFVFNYYYYYYNNQILQQNLNKKKQEALLLLLDVGPSMHSVLPEIEKVCSMLVQKKVLLIPTLFFIQSFEFFLLSSCHNLVFGFVC